MNQADFDHAWARDFEGYQYGPDETHDAKEWYRSGWLAAIAAPGPLTPLGNELVDALRDLFALMDEGWLVRNTTEDDKPGYALRQLGPVQRLAKAHAALAKATQA